MDNLELATLLNDILTLSSMVESGRLIEAEEVAASILSDLQIANSAEN